MKVLFQSLLLLFSFALVFLWEQTPLVDFTLEIIGLLIGFFILVSFARSRYGKQFTFGGALGIFVLNTIILLLVFATGGFSSAFFFLLYFIIFALVFVFEPYTIIAFCIGVVLIFLPIAIKGDIPGNFIKLGSIILISPLALFFGLEYQKTDAEQEAKLKKSAEKIEEDIEEVIESEGNLSKKDKEKLEDVIDEAEKLRKT